jgi:hypothetical protein
MLIIISIIKPAPGGKQQPDFTVFVGGYAWG